MIQNITESTLTAALKHFEIDKLPTAWNGHFDFENCIIKVQKASATVYMSGRFDKSRPAKVRATIDFSNSQGGTILKYLEIYPIIKDADKEPVQLDEDEKTHEHPFILPEIKTLDEARDFIRNHEEDARGIANIGEKTAKERIKAILERGTVNHVAEKLATDEHPADEIDNTIVQNELKDGDAIEDNVEQQVEL